MSTPPDPRVGVFDTLLVRDGVPVAPEPHLRRLADSVQELYGRSLDTATLAERIAVVAGAAPLQRIRIAFAPDAGLSVDAQPITERPRGPVRLIPHRLPGGWGGHKWQDRSKLEEWGDPHDPGADVLLVDEDDHVLETGRGTVYVVPDGSPRTVVTPPLDGRILPGVTRITVLGALAGLGLVGRIRPVQLAELAGAAEVFVSSSIGGVRPVTRCDEIGSWPPGAVTRAVDKAVERAWATAS